MKTQTVKAFRKQVLLATGAGLIAAVMSGNVAAQTTVVGSGILDLNENKLPRLATDPCSTDSSVDATGSSNFPVAFRLFRDGVQVASDNTTSFQANTDQPGKYQLVAVNKKPAKPARITMSLSCN